MQKHKAGKPQRMLRRARGKESLAAFGKRLGCAPSFVFSLENGIYNPSLRLAVKLWREFNIPVELWVASPASAQVARRRKAA